MNYEMDPRTGMFLKGPGRLQEAIERRFERAARTGAQIREMRERRMEAAYERSRFQREPWVDRQTGMPRIGGGSISAAYSLSSATVFALTAGAKTCIMAIAPAGHGLALVHFDVCFDGVTSSAVPAEVDVVSSTQAGAGTAGISTTITQVRGRTTSGSAPTMGGNYTAEPTTLVNLRRLYVPQLMGTYSFDFPLGREFECDSSGGTIKALGIRTNVTANVNGLFNMEVEAIG